MSCELPKGKKLITPVDPALEYMGRIDFDDPSRPMFVWSGSNVTTRFHGTCASVVLRNIKFQEETHFGAVVDGVFRKIFFEDSSEDVCYTLAENLGDTEHTLQLVKTMAAHEYFVFGGFVLDESAQITAPNRTFDLNIEVYGDSVSAGEVVEALYYEGQCDPADHRNKFDNSYYAYPQILGRMLNARVHDIAQGGIALLDNTGFFCADKLTGMVNCYDKIQYSPYYERKQWDFSKFTPDYVIIAIGQNDHQPDPDAIKRPDYRRMWKDKYIEMLCDLMGKYPNAKFLLLLTVLGHDQTWEDALREIADEVNDSRVRYFRFNRGGTGTNGHPRCTEQAEMATELCRYIKEDRNVK